MAGLYIHIPFCKSRCIYCGFYSTTRSRLMEDYVEAVCRELEDPPSIPPRGETNGERRGLGAFKTVYIGGGTPSRLSPALLHKLFGAIERSLSPRKEASCSPPRGSWRGVEVTMECNPDDLTPEYVKQLRKLPVNRISMGIQSFSDKRLRFLHRRHNAEQATEAVSRLRKAGFGNISIDLMFGFPGETLEEWKTDIEKALELQVEHISAYSLMFEEGTPLHRMLEQGKVKEPDEELSLCMFYTLIDMLKAAGYEHYEISNFARPGFHSRHNSSYWDGTPYIGLGAAAHSYDVDTRWWNISDVGEYIRRIQSGESPVEERETLSEATRYDDAVMTALRTRQGLSIEQVEKAFGHEMKDYLMANAQPHLQARRLTIDDGRLRLTREGLFVSDSVMADLMYV